MRIVETDSRTEGDYDFFVDHTYPVTVSQHTIRWKGIIERGLGHEPHYFMAIQENGQPVKGVFPTFLCKSSIGNVLCSLPGAGGYGGILATDVEVVDALFQAALSLAKDSDCMTLTVSTPPFDTCSYSHLFDHKQPNFYQFLNLFEVLNPSRSIRRQIRNGGNVYEGTNADFGDWYNIQVARMLAVGANPSPESYLRAIFESKFPFLVAKHDGNVIGGGLFPFHNTVMDDFMTAGDVNFSGVATPLINAAVNMALLRNVQFFNFQSSPSKGGVYEYKKLWGAIEGEHEFLTKFISPPDYLREIEISKVKRAFKNTFAVPYSFLKNDIHWVSK